MDQRERMDDAVEAFRVGVEGLLAEAWTSMPAIIQDFDPVECTCSAQPAIKGQVRDSTGTTSWVNLPLLTHVPVMFPHSKDFAITFPVKKGDECIVHFSSRDMSLWWSKGGVQQQDELRMHDLSDGFAFVGPYSKPQVISKISTDTVQLRNKDGSCYLELTASGAINIVAPGGLNIKGTTKADSEGTFNGHTVGAHTHTDPQGGVTGGPTG